MSRVELTPVEGPIVVIGVGNPFRSDDGVGHRVVEALAEEVAAEVAADAAGLAPPRRAGRLHRAALHVTDGEPARMIELWRGAELAVVVDAVVTGSIPGRLRVWDALARELPARSAASTHAAGIGEARALAAALDALPCRLVVVGIEAGCTDDGEELSEPVAAAVPAAVRLVKAALATTAAHPAAHVPERSLVVPPATGPAPTTPVDLASAEPTSRTGAPT